MLPEAEGMDVIDKYVTITKKKSHDAEHVGGSLIENDDPLESESKLNRHGLDTMRDY